MRAEIVQAQRRGDVDEVTEDAEAARVTADPAHSVRIDSVGDKLSKNDLAFSRWRSEHAKRPVPRVGLVARHLNDSLKDGGKFQVGRDREDRVEDPLYLDHRRSVTRAKSWASLVWPLA
jgi:hypothetical protein